jgi:hypothetical protein
MAVTVELPYLVAGPVQPVAAAGLVVMVNKVLIPLTGQAALEGYQTLTARRMEAAVGQGVKAQSTLEV